MIRPVVRDFHSPDIDDLEDFEPDKPDSFAFLLELTIGSSNSGGGDLFQIQIVTPTWLEEEHKPDDLVSGEFKLIVFAYDWSRIRDYLRTHVEACAAQSWKEVVAQVGRTLHWEYDEKGYDHGSASAPSGR